MKKLIYLILFFCSSCILVSTSLLASEQNDFTISLRIDSTFLTVNGESRVMDAAPFLKNGRTLVPVRFVSQALNASVYWFPETTQVRIVQGGNEIILVIGSKRVISSGIVKKLDVPPEILNGRTFVPLRFVSEELGARVDWTPGTSYILIKK